MIPHDDHVRVWRVATDLNYLRKFHAESVISQSAYVWERQLYRKANPHRTRESIAEGNT